MQTPGALWTGLVRLELLGIPDIEPQEIHQLGCGIDFSLPGILYLVFEKAIDINKKWKLIA